MEIKSNEVYMINKSNFVSHANIMARICMTLKSAEKEPIDPNVFLEYIARALAIGKCIIFVTFNEEQELNSCAVMLLNNHPTKGKILWIEWAWSDGKNLKLGIEVFKKIENLAQRLGADKIAGSMTRGLKAVYKKYGFITAYTVIEKKVEKEVN